VTGIRPVSQHVPCQNDDLDIAGALGVQPGTFGGALLALASTVQPKSAVCKHPPRVDRDPLCPQKTVDVRYCPPMTNRPEICDPSHMARRRPIGPGRQGADRRGSRPDNSDCQTATASWTRGKSQAPGESETQAGTAESTAADASAAARPGEAGFRVVPADGARADRAHQGRAAGSRGRTRRADRPRCHSGHRMAGHRPSLGCDQASGPPALQASPSRQCYRARLSRCKASSGTVNTCCRTSGGRQRSWIGT
jgi:hypothetical protein